MTIGRYTDKERLLCALSLVLNNPRIAITTNRLKEEREFSGCSDRKINDILRLLKLRFGDIIDLSKVGEGDEIIKQITTFESDLTIFLREKNLIDHVKSQDNNLFYQTIAKLKTNKELFTAEELEIIKGITDTIKYLITKDSYDPKLVALLDVYENAITQFHPYGYIDFSNVKTILQDVIEAKTKQQLCSISYGKTENNISKKKPDYITLPVNIYAHSGKIYIDTFVINEKDIHVSNKDGIEKKRVILKHDLKVRTFALHRIENLKILDYQVPQTLLEKKIDKPNAFGFMHGDKTYFVEVNFKPEMKQYIFERKWPGIKDGTPKIVKDGKFKNWIKLKMDGNNIEEICNWLLGFGANVVVIRGKEIRDRYMEIVNEIKKLISEREEDAEKESKKYDEKRKKKQLKEKTTETENIDPE
ncbi:MAG: WYL domain-containing protein [Deltaproteobacteria bacterium]|jgi:predicted DNA-binding transcriptional regulator YafY|nr:WYL domain-containing protein [Deltaproteobacteria bacterium]